jgi:hypothetical protein
MPVVGRGDLDGVDVLPRKHLAEIADSLSVDSILRINGSDT